MRTNDQKAQVIAQRLCQRFPEGSVSADSLGNVCAYLAEYAKLDYIESMRVLSGLGFTGSPADMLRLAYALIHYQPAEPYAVMRAKVTAHCKVMSVTADRLKSSNPQICLRLLLVSSAHAGKMIDYVTGIRDAVKLQRKIYSGRSRALAGRSLLEFVGVVCTAKLVGDAVSYLEASNEEKKMNKKLCTERAQADTSCAKAETCALCKERRATCRLSVRY